MSAPITREAAAALAAALVGEMSQRWRRGEYPLVEEFLEWHPELWDYPEAAADLIYEELCLRQEFGQELPAEEVLSRFPQWRPQVEMLLDCQLLLGPRRVAPKFPSVGESLGEFQLLAELGSGAHGVVFLASQLSLGDRPVVLKVTLCEAHEHLSLARLQHTHIVPLYSAQDYPALGLRALCMPYFGGATLSQLLDVMNDQLPARRTGQDLLNALDRASEPFSGCHSPGPARQFLARATYIQAICWVGACLADALQYAHDRCLVHLDLKPSNVLLATDGQPMLLDFHLAREPILAGGAMPRSLGGTVSYMSPEQEATLQALRQRRPLRLGVDGRSDVYSLGVLLYEALAGEPPETCGKVQPLNERNPRVSIGLADVIGKCLAQEPNHRFPNMAGLAVDLRRHLADLPLAGVRNRSLGERWQKWRRRRPYGVALVGMMLAVLTAAFAVMVGAASHFAQQVDQARAALNEGQAQMDDRQWETATRTLQRGLIVYRAVPFQEDLANALERRLRVAEQARSVEARVSAARELHQLADRARYLYGTASFPTEEWSGIEVRCRTFWMNRTCIVERLRPYPNAPLESAVREDLLDLAIFWADLQVRRGAAIGKEEARRHARTALGEAEALLGSNPVLDEERKLHGVPVRVTATAPVTAWEHCALGRALLRAGKLERAALEFDRAVRLNPQGLWPNFYRGLCAYRLGRHEDAATAFSLCIGAAPEPAGSFYNRALALEALGRSEQARDDYSQALRIDPTLAAAALNRGMLEYRAGRLAGARADLQQARRLGADPALVSLDLALIHVAAGDHASAFEELRQLLNQEPRRAYCPSGKPRTKSVKSAPDLPPPSR